MKRFFLIVVCLIVIAGVAGGFFLYSKLDGIKEDLLEHARNKTGRYIELGKLGWAFSGGLAVRIEDFKVYPGLNPQVPPMLEIPSIDVRINLRLMLQGILSVESVLIDSPVLRLSSGSFVSVRPSGSAPSSKPSSDAPKKASGAAGPALNFITDTIAVRNGTVIYETRTEKRVDTLVLRKADIRLNRWSMTAPFTFSVKASVLESAKQNAVIDGQMGSLQDANPLKSLKLKARLDLTPVDFSLVKKAMPSLAGLPFTAQAVKGTLDAEVASIEVDARGKLKGLAAKGKVMLDSVAFDSVPATLTQMSIPWEIRKDTLTVKEATALAGKGKLGLEINSRSIFTAPTTSVVALIRDMPVHDWVKPGAVEFYGDANAQVRLTFTGTESAQIQHSMNGSGEFNLKNATVKNLNVAARVIQRVSEVPIIGTDIANSLSQKFQPFIQNPDMKLELAEGSFTIANRSASVTRLDLRSDYVGALAQGFVTFDGDVSLPTTLYFSPEMSAAMISSMNDLSILADGYGRLVFPCQIEGRFPDIRVNVDGERVVAPIVQVRAQKLMNRFLETSSQAPAQTPGAAEAAPGAAQTAPGAAEAAPSDQDVVSQLIDKMLR